MAEHRAGREALGIGIVAIAERLHQLGEAAECALRIRTRIEESNANPLLGRRRHAITIRCWRMVLKFFDFCSSGTGATKTGSWTRGGWVATIPRGSLSMRMNGSAMQSESVDLLQLGNDVGILNAGFGIRLGSSRIILTFLRCGDQLWAFCYLSLILIAFKFFGGPERLLQVLHCKPGEVGHVVQASLLTVRTWFRDLLSDLCIGNITVTSGGVRLIGRLAAGAGVP